MDQNSIMAFLASLYAAPLYIDDVTPDQWDIVQYCERAALIRRAKDIHGNKCFVITETCKFTYPSLGNDVIAIRRQNPNK